MPYYYAISPTSTLEQALQQSTVDELKVLCQLLPGGKLPTRKADLVAHVMQALQGKSLQKLWAQCDRLQQSAIAEVVHSDSPRFFADRFHCKKNCLPSGSGG
jgi:hypothetical protein